MNNEQIEKEIVLLKERNKLVDTNKSWEVSFTRRVLVALTTYFVMVLFFYSANIENYFLSAVVPTLGFVLSTFSLDFAKNYWIKKNNL